MKLNPGLPGKRNIQQDDSFHQKTGLKFEDKTTFRAWLFMVLKLRHFGKYIRNTGNFIQSL
jgi:hypothetical protein